MTIITLKDRDETANTLISLQTWRRNAKECNQSALYDALSEAIATIKALDKALKDTGKTCFETFTRSAADVAFSDYIRARAQYQLLVQQRCARSCPLVGKQNGVRCHNRPD